MDVFDHPDLSTLDSRETQLWILAIALLTVLSSGIAALMYPAVFSSPVMLNGPTMKIEHLPPAETEESLQRIRGLLRPTGVGVIGVPIEMYLPAAVKGLFRITRRFGDYDATPLNVLRASLGSPPRNRPLSEIASGLRYYFHHMGFDHRRLAAQMQPHFHVRRSIASPCPPLGTFLNSEVYFLVEKRGAC